MDDSAGAVERRPVVVGVLVNGLVLVDGLVGVVGGLAAQLGAELLVFGLQFGGVGRGGSFGLLRRVIRSSPDRPALRAEHR